MNPPEFPVGPFIVDKDFGSDRRNEFIHIIETTPIALRKAVSNLSNEQLDTRYRNWTVRQIAYHLADSHVNSYVRFKLALTEETPTIKPYDEARWVALNDSTHGSVQPPLEMLDGLHKCWVQLLRMMTDEQFERCFWHPESQKTVRLADALAYYAWHGQHHVGQILWLREHHQWS